MGVSRVDARASLPWLLDLASAQADSGPDPTVPHYVDDEQMSYVRLPSYQLAIDSGAAFATKKADRETGEDQKGF